MSKVEYILGVLGQIGKTNSFSDIDFPQYDTPLKNVLIQTRFFDNSLTFWIPVDTVQVVRDGSVFPSNIETGMRLTSDEIKTHKKALDSLHERTKESEKSYETVSFFTGFFPKSDTNGFKQDIYYVNVIFE